MQPHMSKCFDAIKSIRFGDGAAEHDIFGFKVTTYPSCIIRTSTFSCHGRANTSHKAYYHTMRAGFAWDFKNRSFVGLSKGFAFAPIDRRMLMSCA